MRMGKKGNNEIYFEADADLSPLFTLLLPLLLLLGTGLPTGLPLLPVFPLLPFGRPFGRLPTILPSTSLCGSGARVI